MKKNLNEYYGCLSDGARPGSYRVATGQWVRPMQVALDQYWGSGPLGLMPVRVGVREVIGQTTELPDSGKRYSQSTFKGLLPYRDKSE